MEEMCMQWKENITFHPGQYFRSTAHAYVYKTTLLVTVFLVMYTMFDVYVRLPSYKECYSIKVTAAYKYDCSVTSVVS